MTEPFRSHASLHQPPLQLSYQDWGTSLPWEHLAPPLPSSFEFSVCNAVFRALDKSLQLS